jgi:serine/threonine protein kinase
VKRCDIRDRSASHSLIFAVFPHDSDVWSFGVAAFEIVHRQVPYPDQESFEAALAVARGTLHPQINSPLPALNDTVVRCFERTPEARPTAQTLSREFASMLDDLRRSDESTSHVSMFGVTQLPTLIPAAAESNKTANVAGGGDNYNYQKIASVHQQTSSYHLVAAVDQRKKPESTVQRN